MKVCDRCGAGGKVDRVEIRINNRLVDKKDFCNICENELYNFNNAAINRQPRPGFIKSTLQMFGFK
jgi:hypothetical protein